MNSRTHSHPGVVAQMLTCKQLRSCHTILFLFFSTLLPAQVLINEVVTDPQQDWSTTAFDGTISAGTIDADDDWIELYITSAGLDLTTNWVIELNDGTDESGSLNAGGAFVVSNYMSSSGGTIDNTQVGDYLILGTMTTGAINQSVTVVLRDGLTIIDQVEIASGSGTGFTGNATDVTDESVCRIPNGQDTDVDATDFVLSRATLGTSNSPTGIVLINEAVTNPRTDWSTNNFDGTDGGSTISEVDEWIELYIGTDDLNLTKWTFSITDSDGSFSGDLTSTGAFDVVNYIGSGDFTQTDVGDYLVLGNPDGSNDMNTDVYIQLFDADGTLVDDVEIGDDEEGDGIGDGAPDSFGSTVENESVARISNGSDTDVDATDFQGVVSTLGTENGILNVFVDDDATDDTGLGTVADPKQLIQSAIDLVLSGGTVTVLAGDYSENLTINKNLTLNGPNQGVAGNGTRGTESRIDPSSQSTVINVSSDDVTIDGIQVGTDAATSNATGGIVATGSNISISNNIIYANSSGISVSDASTGTVDISDNLISMIAVEDVTNPTIGSVGILLANISGDADADVLNNDISNAGTGISAYALTSSTEALIDGGAFTGCMLGILPLNIDGLGGFSPSTLTIQNITMSGFVTDTDVVSPDTEAGIYVVSSGGTAADDITITIDNVDISGVGNGAATGASNNSGIIIGDFPSASNGAEILATITNSNIHDNENRGIYTRGADALTDISQTSITGNGFNPHASGGNFGFSIIAREGSTTTVSNCFIDNPATLSSPEDIGAGYYVSGMHISTGSLTVSDCSLNQNGNGFIAETSGIDLSGNYFNTTDEATILTLAGSGNDFTPWLSNATDTDLGTNGFQGDFSDLNVGVSGAQTGSSGRIEEGISLVDATGSVAVNAGTYPENLTISKSLTLNGANVGVAGSGSRGAESIIEPSSANVGITVGATDITIDGFQFGTDNTTSNHSIAISNAGFSGSTMSNNVIYANTAGVAISGISSGSTIISSNAIEMLDLEDPLNSNSPSLGINAQSISGTADVDFVDNDIQSASYGFFGYALTATPIVTIDGGSYSGCTKGIEINNTDGLGAFSPSNVDVANVTMSGFVDPGAGLAQPDTQAGIYVFTTGAATTADDIAITIDNVDISGIGNTGTDYSAIYIADFQATGPFLGTDDDGIGITADITNSNIHDNLNRGIHTRGRNAITNITACTLSDNGTNPNPGAGAAVNVYAQGTANVQNSVLTNPSSGTTSLLVSQQQGIISAFNNSLDNNSNPGGLLADIQSGTTGSIDMSGNWLGETSDAAILALIDFTPSDIDFTPYLESGIDSDGSTQGFQGDFDAITVTPSGFQTTGDRVQEGHDLLNTNGTITILQDDYTETLTVSKDIIIDPEASTTIDDITLDGGRFSVIADLEINNILTLTNGILDIDLDDGDKSDDPVLILNNAVAGAFDDANHIEGIVQVAIGAASSFDFPVGDTDSYRPVSLTPAGATTFNVSHVEEATPTGGGITNPDITDLITDASTTPSGTIESVLNFRYWTIDVVTGTPGSTDVTLQIPSGDNASDPAELGMTRFDGSDWLLMSMASPATGSGPYLVTAQTSTFSDFSIYSTDASANPLPVELIGFSGRQEGRDVRLSWATLSEVNSDHFSVERSEDGESFYAIGSVTSHGNTNQRHDYSYVDMNVGGGLHYYRLKMVDFDGSFEYSPTIQVAPDLSNIKVSVYPNPSSGFIQIHGIGTDLIKGVEFYDLNGRLNQRIHDINESVISLGNLQSGHYLLRIQMVDGSVFEGEIVKK